MPAPGIVTYTVSKQYAAFFLAFDFLSSSSSFIDNTLEKLYAP